MTNNTKTIAVKILSKEYQVTCPVGSEDQLLEASQFLDKKMREIKQSGRIIGLERMAVMAALNISNELLTFKQQKEEYVQSVTEQIERLQNKIDEVLMDNAVANVTENDG